MYMPTRDRLVTAKLVDSLLFLLFFNFFKFFKTFKSFVIEKDTRQHKPSA